MKGLGRQVAVKIKRSTEKDRALNPAFLINLEFPGFADLMPKFLADKRMLLNL